MGKDPAHNHDVELPASLGNPPGTTGPPEAINEDRDVTPPSLVNTHTLYSADITSPPAAHNTYTTNHGVHTCP